MVVYRVVAGGEGGFGADLHQPSVNHSCRDKVSSEARTISKCTPIPAAIAILLVGNSEDATAQLHGFCGLVVGRGI